MSSIQNATAILIDQAAEQGLTINLSPGKTEGMLIRAGTGIRKAMETSQGKIKAQTMHSGEIELRFRRQYKHLGGILNGEGDMDPALSRRNAMATASDLRMPTMVHKEVLVLSCVRLMLSNAVSFSRLRYNCQIWTKLMKNKQPKWTASYNNIIRNAIPKVNGPDNQWTKMQIPAQAEKPEAMRYAVPQT